MLKWLSFNDNPLAQTKIMIDFPKPYFVEIGAATYYDYKSNTRITGSGESFNRYNYTCAYYHPKFNDKSHFYGLCAKIINLENGCYCLVKITDSGEFRDYPTKHNIIVDLTPAVFEQLGVNLKHGVIKQIKIEIYKE
jgi:rare lipoprotein A (peptidoglycan hydrolase)